MNTEPPLSLSLREGNTPGPAGMHSEFFRLLDDESDQFLTGIFRAPIQLSRVQLRMHEEAPPQKSL